MPLARAAHAHEEITGNRRLDRNSSEETKVTRKIRPINGTETGDAAGSQQARLPAINNNRSEVQLAPQLQRRAAAYISAGNEHTTASVRHLAAESTTARTGLGPRSPASSGQWDTP